MIYLTNLAHELCSIHQVVGKPPCIMSGMTPTTSTNGLDLVAACGNGGYHGELAGGGLPLPDYARASINRLVEMQNPGVGITLNMLYLNAYLWGFQVRQPHPFFRRLNLSAFFTRCVCISQLWGLFLVV